MGGHGLVATDDCDKCWQTSLECGAGVAVEM